MWGGGGGEASLTNHGMKYSGYNSVHEYNKGIGMPDYQNISLHIAVPKVTAIEWDGDSTILSK